MTLPCRTHSSGLCKYGCPCRLWSLRTGGMGTLFLLLFVLSLYGQTSMCAPCQIFDKKADCSVKNLTAMPTLPSDIQDLRLESNRISELHSGSLRGLPLERLDLRDQKVPLVIRNDTFLSQQQLKILVLGPNRGLRLEPRAFAGLYALQELYMDYCDLTPSILSGNYLQSLWSLKKLVLAYNKIVRVQPAKFFSKLTNLEELDLKHNQIEILCEEDLVAFQGKTFARFNLEGNHFYKNMSHPDFDWEQCGNPFRNMVFNCLDLSSNGFNANTLRLLFKAIDGTSIALLRYNGAIGHDFSFNNLDDPDKHTFKGLRNSSVQVLDLSCNHIFALQHSVFSHLTNATIINLSHNNINEINQGAFWGLQNSLRMLNLSFNLLGEIHYHTFASLTDLRVLDLSYNHIGKCGHEAFSGLVSLEQLNLTGNSLRKLESRVSLPQLLFLYLNDNRLSSLYGLNELAGPNMAYLAVKGNRLIFLDEVFTTVKHFRHLDQLYFGGNFMKWCQHTNKTVMNSSVTLLDLHDSSLQIIWAQGWCLDIFQPFSKLLKLNLTYNYLTHLPRGIFNSLQSIEEIDLSFNELTFLRPDTFPRTLLRLHLSSNFLVTPDPDTFRHLAFIDLAGNPFYCDCYLESFLRWMNSTNVTFLHPVEELRCGFPSQLQNVPLQSFDLTEPCEEDDEKVLQELRVALFIFSTVAVVATMLGALVYTHLRGHVFIIYKKMIGRIVEGPKPPPPEENMQYDAFVCYSDADYKWVERALLQKLDSGFSEKNLLRCCIEARDFLPGEDHLLNIRDAIWGSRKTICVVSRRFLKDGWCLEAFSLAQGRKLEELSNILIMIVVGKVSHYELIRHDAIRAFVQTEKYLLWPEDPQDLDWFYERLVAEILKKKKQKKEEEEEDGGHPAEDNAVPMVILQPQVV